MKNTALTLAFAFALAFTFTFSFSGCATVKASTEEGRTIVSGECTSWRIFWWIPLFGGDCDDPNDDYCAWFQNTATLENSVKLLDYACRKKHARGVKDVNTLVEEEHFFFIMRRTAIYTSAELVY